MNYGTRKRRLMEVRQTLGAILMTEPDPDVAIYIQEALLKLEKAQHEMEKP